MDLQAMERLIQLLEALGFDRSLEQQLLKKVSFCLPRFSLQVLQQRQGDHFGFQLFFERTKEGFYLCPYYDAFLRNKMPIPEVTVNGISSKALTHRMEKIDWKNYFGEHTSSESTLQDWEFFLSVESITSDLLSLSATEEGKEAVLILKIHFWGDVPGAEVYWNASLKTRFEIVQRFYLSQQGSITADEAYRFLQNRWMEKELQSKKKEGLPQMQVERSSKTNPVKKRKQKQPGKN